MKKLIYIAIALIFLNKNINALTFNNDSLKNKYELNDPRNPNCPCHKYQKLADEEFANSIKQTQFNKVNAVQQTITTQTRFADASTGSNLNRSAKTKHFKKFIITLPLAIGYKNKLYKIFNFNKSHRGKKRHHVRSSKNISSCFGWR